MKNENNIKEPFMNQRMILPYSATTPKKIGMGDVDKLTKAQQKREAKNAKRIRDRDRQSINGEMPKDPPCTCYDCGWKGYISDCNVEEDSDGWEYPTYLVAVCPSCGYAVEV